MFEFDPEFYDSKSDVQFKLGLKTINELKLKDGETILDIGCGTGRLTFELAKKNPSGRIIGIDIGPKMITKAVENLQKSGLKNIEFISKGILQYNPDLQFDAVFSNSALHWVQKTQDLYEKIHDILIPGGRLVAQVPTEGGYSRLIPYFMEPIKTLNLSEYYKNWKYPVKLIKLNALQRILTSVGFKNVKVWVEDQIVEFNTPEELVTFLKTAAIVPILSQLPPEKQTLYINSLLTIFKTREDISLDLTMKRLFLRAIK